MTSSCPPMMRTGPSASSCWGLPWSPGWQVWRPEMKLITNFCVSCNISNHWKEMVAGGSRGALHWRLAAPVLCSERRHAAHRTVDFPISSEHFLSSFTFFCSFLTGFAGGAFVLAAPAYSSEIAETKYRGALGTVMQLMVTLGILFIQVNCNTDWKGGVGLKSE